MNRYRLLADIPTLEGPVLPMGSEVELLGISGPGPETVLEQKGERYHTLASMLGKLERLDLTAG